MKKVMINLSDIDPKIRHAVREKAYKKPNTIYTHNRIIYDYELIFLISGKMVVNYDGSEHVIRPFDIHVMPPGVWHSREIRSSYIDYVNMHFDLKYDPNNTDFDIHDVYLRQRLVNGAVPVRENLMKRTDYCLPEFETPLIIGCSDFLNFLTLCLEVNDLHRKTEISLSPGVILQEKGKFIALLGFILDEMAKQGNFSSLEKHIDKIKEYISNNPYQETNIKETISYMGYSYDYFKKKFHEVVGVSLLEFSNDRKMIAAKQLLGQGYRISEVATALKFGDAYLFSKFFKRREGMSPNEYRKKFCGDEGEGEEEKGE